MKLSQLAKIASNKCQASLVLQHNKPGPHPASGMWSFKGDVPVHLMYEYKSGKRLSDQDAEDIGRASVPSMLIKSRNIKSRYFKTKKDAINAARKEKAKITQVFDPQT